MNRDKKEYYHIYHDDEDPWIDLSEDQTDWARIPKNNVYYDKEFKIDDVLDHNEDDNENKDDRDDKDDMDEMEEKQTSKKSSSKKKSKSSKKKNSKKSSKKQSTRKSKRKKQNKSITNESNQTQMISSSRSKVCNGHKTHKPFVHQIRNFASNIFIH